MFLSFLIIFLFFHDLNKIGSRNQYKSIEHKKISILTKSQLPNPSGRPKNAPKTFQKSVDLNRPQPTSPRPLHKPSKIRDLGLLTYISRKSVSRRCSRCNSQNLTPSGRRVMKETVFIPSWATRGENRLRRSIPATRGDPP